MTYKRHATLAYLDYSKIACEWHWGGVTIMEGDFRPRARTRSLFVSFALVLSGPWMPAAFAAGGAFVVDDAKIGNPGDCEVDSWAAGASNHDLMAVTSPYCVVRLGIPVQLGAALQRSRNDDLWSSSATLSAKTNIIPVEKNPFGLGISGGGSWDLVTGANTGGYINVPLMFQLRDSFRINVNGGWMYDNVAKINYATWGAGFEWDFPKQWDFPKPMTLIGEVYGLLGRLPAVDDGSVPPDRSIVEPRAQIGVRYTPQDKIDIDVIYGHNITGENAHWLTLGVNLRF